MKNKKKILFVIESLAIGGAEKSLVNLLNSLDFSEFEVDLFLFAKGGALEERLPDFVRVKHILLSYPFTARLNFALRRKIRGGMQTEDLFWKSFGNFISEDHTKYDIAVGYSQGFATYYVAEKVQAPIKFAWVNTDYRKAGYNAEFDKDFYQKMDGIVAVSDAGTQIFKEVFNSKDLHVPLHTIEDLLDINTLRKQAKEPCSISEFSGLKIVSVGRLHPAKGFELAIEAASILKAKGINFRWWIIGEGAERPKLERLIEEKNLRDFIVLQGADTNPYRYMNAADIYVQTSLYEGFSITVREALALGKPVVSTNFPSVSSAIVHGVNGLLCDMNSEAIAFEICKMLDTALRSAIIERSSVNSECKENNKIMVLNQLLGV